MNLFANLFSTMGMLALEYRSGGLCAPLNELPEWFRHIHPGVERNPAQLDIAALFPFVDNFLVDAEAFWQQQTGERVGSGVWTELDEHGKQHQLEAWALLYQQTPILLLTDLTRTFDARHHVYQRAREIALAQEGLISSLQRQQRKLQLKLQAMLTQAAPLASISERISSHASAVLVCKPDGSVELLNQALVDIYPAHADGSQFSSRSVLNQWVSEAERFYPEIHRVIETGSCWEGEFETAVENGDKKWVRLMIGPVLDENQCVSHLVCVANDISSLREPSIELERVTDYDFTTQLPNRRHFWRVLIQSIDECRATGERLVLLYLDIDHFKRINDSLDHQAGDILLSTLSSRLLRHIKRTDFIAHLGGDEFAVVLRTARQHLDVASIAERLLQVVRQPLLIGDSTISITASIGLSCFPEHASDAVGLMKHSDLAMYHAKQLGRNQFQMYTRDLEEAFIHRTVIQKDLAGAITGNQLHLVYQPQICLGANSFLRLEALLRWQHPVLGLVSPAVFIPVAEESGQILSVGNWVLEQACAQARQFLDQQIPVVMSVNVSARQIHAPDFFQSVQRALAHSGLPPAQLELEITETALLDNMETRAQALQQLQEMGVSIALDDFGSGFSSLNYLKQLPVDRLKIDQLFIREIPHDEESKTITASVVKLAHELKMSVVAEGVETWDQLNFLQGIGCDYVQGFLLFRPLPPEEIGVVFARLASLRFDGENSSLPPFGRA